MFFVSLFSTLLISNLTEYFWWEIIGAPSSNRKFSIEERFFLEESFFWVFWEKDILCILHSQPELPELPRKMPRRFKNNSLCYSISSPFVQILMTVLQTLAQTAGHALTD